MKPVITIFRYKFKVRDLFLLISSYLLIEPIFSWLLIQNAPLLEKYEQILSLGVFGFVLVSFFRLPSQDKMVISLFTIIIVKLIIESLIIYGSVFEYFAMYSVLFPVVYIVFCKYLFRMLDFDVLEFLAKFYLLTYFVFMLLFGRSFSFSLQHYGMEGYLGPFSGDSRIIHAKSILMMLIPFLWYLNKYFKTRAWKPLLLTVTCFVIIVVHQHRSVWTCLILAVGYYLLLKLRFEEGVKNRIWKFGLASAVVLALSLVALSAIKPDLVNFFAERFSEILEPTLEESTNNFRIQQREVYFGLSLDKPFFGWSFEGYVLPNPLVDWWPAKTGQHFHEGFIEILFYHGLAGLVLKYFFLIYILVKSWRSQLSEKATILSAFCVTGLAFSLAYVPSLLFWGHVGLCLFYIEKEKDISASPAEKD